MTYAIIGGTDGVYQAVAILHILSAIVAFGPTFGMDLMGKRAGEVKGQEGLILSHANEMLSSKLVFPFAYITGGLGVVLVLLSDVIEFSDTWIGIAFALYFVGLANAHINLKRTATRMIALQEELAAGQAKPGEAGGPPAQAVELEALGKKMPMYSGIAHLVIVALVWVMIVKPG